VVRESGPLLLKALALFAIIRNDFFKLTVCVGIVADAELCQEAIDASKHRNVCEETSPHHIHEALHSLRRAFWKQLESQTALARFALHTMGTRPV